MFGEGARRVEPLYVDPSMIRLAGLLESLSEEPGAVCTVGAASPFTWIDAPSATDGSGLIWWLMLVRDGSDEGSWGLDGAANERSGDGPNGSSGQCGVVDKKVTNVCGR